MSANRYTIVESVGNRIESVTSYDDLEKHHPSSGKEAGRDYAEIDGGLEEVRPMGDGRTLIKKDFVLLVNGSNKGVAVPSPVAGYVKTRRAFGTVTIHETPGGKLLGQILHLDPAFKVKDGDYVNYGQILGIQSGTGANGTTTYAVHVHAELEKDQFTHYISDLLDGTLTPNGPAPASTPVVTNWSYPFAGASSNPLENLTRLAKARNGLYPLGTNGLWHGGVHFDQGTAAVFDQSCVRCIADGEVVAYRIDNKYPETHYGAIVPGRGPEPLGAKFSTGFVLVKHRLELPAVPPTPAPTTGDAAASPPATAPSAAATPADAAPAAEALTFYSLYMHLLDWAGYQAAAAPKPPVFLAPTSHCVSNRTTDPLMGLRVRKGPSGGATEVLALLPKGCKVTLGEAADGAPRWRQLLSVDDGAAVPPLPADTIGWVYTGELTGTTVGDLATDTEPALTASHQGLNVRREGKRTGAIIGVLPQGAALKVGPKESSGYCKVLEVTDYRGVPALPNGADGKPLGYVYHSSLDSMATEPASKDTVYLLPTPHRIKAGELVGHIGLYQDHDESTPKPRLHLEVFSCDDVPAFIAQSRARAASLPADRRTLLKIHKGASKLIPHRADISATNPPKTTDAGITVGVDLTLPIGVLEGLPADRKIQVSEAVPGSTTPRITHWWRLDNLLADEAGKLISGWLAEQELITTRHSPWEWEGFDFIRETSCAADHLACHLDAQRLLTEAEQPDYQAQISTADHGPIKTRLYDIIDGADGSTRDDKLSVREIRAALSKPWHAQSISRLITHYESEWFWKEEKWDELDELMEHTPEDPNPSWVAEKERIKKLSWWDALTESQEISTDGSAWHFQPVGLLETHSSKQKPTIKEGQITFDAEGNDIPSSPYFSRMAHWPGNELSGVTLGRGYDMGSRSKSEIYNHMIAAGVDTTQASKISQAHGLKGNNAQQFVTTNKENIGEISRDQQISLFNLIYSDYVSRAIANYNSWTSDEPGRIEWSGLKQVIKDVLVDFVYQGFTKGPNPMKAGMNNDANKLITYIESTPAISQYEGGRHRADYLRKNK